MIDEQIENTRTWIEKKVNITYSDIHKYKDGLLSAANVFFTINRILRILTIIVGGITVVNVFYMLPVPIPVLIGLLLLAMGLGTLNYKYVIDFSSVIKMKESDRQLVQEKNIEQLLQLMTAVNYLLITLILQFLFQNAMDRYLTENIALLSLHPSWNENVIQALWFTPFVNHLFLLIPGIPFAMVHWTNNHYLLFTRYKRFTQRWLIKEYFTNGNFFDLFNPRRHDFEPNINLGEDLANGGAVIIPWKDRTLNMAFFGMVGVGKSQSIFKPIAYQDALAMVRYWRVYGELREKYPNKEDFDRVFYSEEYSEMMLNGMTIIEPSNDLVRGLYDDFTKKMGIPKEAIHYVNPAADPYKDGEDYLPSATINLLSGPLDKVAGILVSVIGEVSHSGNTFFDNLQDAFFKNLIYLLKLSVEMPNPLDEERGGKPPTLQQLVDMMLDIEILWQRQTILEEYVAYLEAKLTKLKKEAGLDVEALDAEYQRIEELHQRALFEKQREQYARKQEDGIILEEEGISPEEHNLKIQAEVLDYETQKDVDDKFDGMRNEAMLRLSRDAKPSDFEQAKILEEENKWRIARETYLYWKAMIKEVVDKQGNLLYREIDPNVSKNIGNLENILNRLSQNVGIKRVFFSESTFDLDVFLKYGGVLLVNTDKGGLGQDDSSLLGKLISLSFQNAVYRRTPNVDPGHGFGQDEFVDYAAESSAVFFSQSRKYKIFSYIALQAETQLTEKYSDPYRRNLLTNFGTQFVFGGYTDGQILKDWEAKLGKKWIITQGYNKTEIDVKKGQDQDRESVSEKEEQVPNMEAADISQLPQWELAGNVRKSSRTTNFIRLKTTPAFNRGKEIKHVKKEAEATLKGFSVWYQDFQEALFEVNEKNKVHFDDPNEEALMKEVKKQKSAERLDKMAVQELARTSIKDQINGTFKTNEEVPKAIPTLEEKAIMPSQLSKQELTETEEVKVVQMKLSDLVNAQEVNPDAPDISISPDNVMFSRPKRSKSNKN